jgi:hypothetical protein
MARTSICYRECRTYRKIAKKPIATAHMTKTAATIDQRTRLTGRSNIQSLNFCVLLIKIFTAKLQWYYIAYNSQNKNK